jgi:hypothetical protein
MEAVVMKRVGLFGLIQAHSWLIRAAPLTSRYLQPPSPGSREPREGRLHLIQPHGHGSGAC